MTTHRTSGLTPGDEWRRLSTLPPDEAALQPLAARVRSAAGPLLAARRRRGRAVDVSLALLSAAAAVFIVVELAPPAPTTVTPRWSAMVAPTDSVGRGMIAMPAPPAVATLLASYLPDAPPGER